MCKLQIFVSKPFFENFSLLLLFSMVIASISYTSPSPMYAVGSEIQLVCKDGYHVSLHGNEHVQKITCSSQGLFFLLSKNSAIG